MIAFYLAEAAALLLRLLRAVDWACRQLLLWLVIAYQKSIGRLFAGRCRFVPSCSQYARLVLARFSTPRALQLIIWRLLRCQPLCRGGEDPPPDR